jgi:glutaconate CoA-transferase subunit A
MTPEEVVDQLSDGMTLGIGGWGSRRKPMALVRAIARSSLTDLTVVSYGGPDVGILCALGKVRKLVYGFVSLDSIPLEPHFRKARQNGTIPEVVELDEGMFQLGLRAAAWGVPFLPTRAGLGSDVMRVNPHLKTVASPYGDEELVAVPALKLDAALVHVNRADERGNGQVLGPDPYFDDWFCMAADKAYVSCEKLGLEEACLHSRLLNRTMVDGIIEAPGGAWFTECPPDYDRNEALQAEYAATAKDPEAWDRFVEAWLS